MARGEGPISYAAWGEDFFRTAVSEQRILGAVNNLAGKPIDFGPIGVGPGRIAKVRAEGAIGRADARRDPGDEPVTYRVRLPVDLAFEVDLQVETHRFHAELEVPLVLTARAMPGVRILVEVAPPSARDVAVVLRADGLRASVLQRVANVEGELRRFVARYVARELTKPYVEKARTIDVAGMIDRAYASLPAAGRPHGREVMADFNEALEEEIRENEDTFFDTQEGSEQG